MEEVYVVIPAFRPESEFCRRIEEIRLAIPSQIVVVDDGSGEEFREIFGRVEQAAGCTVIRHERNRGKGTALKTGFRYIKNQIEQAAVRSPEGNADDRTAGERGGRILCIDCDGQHLPADALRILERAEEHPEALVLGVRDFSGADIPWRSRLGNRVSSGLFEFFGQVRLEDTQTGLRAFGCRLLDLMICVPGRRYEYEMHALIACVREGVPILTETIDTLYIDDNSSSHFRPLRDSLRVTAVLLMEPGRFVLSSLFCACLDVGLFRLMEGMPGDFLGIAAATAAARCVSASLNFFLNRYWVFQPHLHRNRGGILRYFSLGAGIAAASALSVSALSGIFEADPALVKIPCDLVLFFISYVIQKKWVFSHGTEDGGFYEC